MKKKFLFLLGFFAIFCTFMFSGLPTGIVYAEEQTTTYYTYSIADSTYTISTSNTETSYTTIESVISAIKTAAGTSDTISIEFNSLSITESISIDFNATITGTVSSTASIPLFIISSGTVSFESVTLSGAYIHLIETAENSSNCTVKINGGTFSSTSTDSSYVIYFYGTGHTFEFGSVITNSCTFFTKTGTGVKITVTSALYTLKDGSDTEIDTASSLLKVVVAYDVISDDSFIAIYFNSDYYNLNKNYVSLSAATTNSYSVIQTVGSTDNLNYLTAYVCVNLNFVIGDDATINDEGYKTYFYYNTTNPNYKEITYPTDVVRDYYNFCGFFGKITLSDTLKTLLDTDADELYYDAYMLQQYAQAGADKSTMLEYFKTTVSECDESYSLTGYTYNDGTTKDISYYQNFYGTVFMLENDCIVELVAKWEKQEFTITFNSNGGSDVSSITEKWGETISAPTAPTLEGYTFANWCTDENLTETYTFSVMGTKDITLYASYTINSYTITLQYNNGDASEEKTLEFGTTINFSSLISGHTKTGYNFSYWCTDESLTEEFTNTTMPANNVTLYAKWLIQTFIVIFNSNGGTTYSAVSVEYGNTVSVPATPEKTGYSFLGWFTDSNFYYSYDFSTQITENLTLYASWRAITYTITFDTGNGSYISPLSTTYGSEISLETPSLTGYSFVGWFTDTDLTEEFTSTTMPANNITLYAKWEQKKTITLYLDAQEYDYESFQAYYKNFSSISGFTVYYLVDGNWQTEVPTSAGTYNIKLERQEDDTYQAYSQEFEAMFVINRQEIDVTWIYAILFSLAIIEAGVVILLSHLKKMKASRVFSILPVAIGTNYEIAGNEFILLVVSAVMALAGFVAIIFMLVSLHRTVGIEEQTHSNLDNRERFKEDLVFQNENNGDEEYFVSVKSDETYGGKYSAEDIQNLLNNDTFAKDIERRKNQTQDNSSINWNKESENEGSDVIQKSRDISEFMNENLKENVEFVDDDEEIDSILKTKSNDDDE